MNKMNFNDLVYQNLTYAFAGGVFLCVIMISVMFMYIMNLRKRNSNRRNSLANKVCGQGQVAIDIGISESGRTSSSSVSIKSLNKKIHSIKRNQKSDRMEYYNKSGMPIGPLSALNIGTCNSIKIHENELMMRQQHFGANQTKSKLLPGLGCLPDVKIHLSRGCGVSSKKLFGLNRLSCKKRLIEELRNNGDHFTSEEGNLKNNRSIKSSKALSKVMKRTELNKNTKKTSSKKLIKGSISFGGTDSRKVKTYNTSTKSSPAINPGFIIVDKNNQDCSVSGHPNNRHSRKSRKSIRSQNSVVCNLHLGYSNDLTNSHLGTTIASNHFNNNRSVKSNMSNNSQSILPSEIASFSAENQSAGMPKLHSLQSLDQLSEDSGFINNIVEQLKPQKSEKSFGLKNFSFKKSTKSNNSNFSQNTTTNCSLGQATCNSNMSPASVYQNRGNRISEALNRSELPPIGANVLQDDFDQAHLENIEIGPKQGISPPGSSYQSYGSSVNSHQPLSQKDSSMSNQSQNINNFHKVTTANIEPPQLVSFSHVNKNNSILKFNRYGSKIYQENYNNLGRVNPELGYGSLSHKSNGAKVKLSAVQSVPLQQSNQFAVYSSKETLDSIEENENQMHNSQNDIKRSSPISFKPFSAKYVKTKLSERFSRESKDSAITVSTNLSSTSDIHHDCNDTKKSVIVKKKLTATSSCGHTLVASYGSSNRQIETLDVSNLKKFKSEKVNKKKLEARNSIGELLKNSPKVPVNHGFLTFDNLNNKSKNSCIFASSSTLNTNSSGHTPLTNKNSLVSNATSGLGSEIANNSGDENQTIKGISINCNSNLTLDDLKNQIKRNSCMYQRKMSIACGASPVPAAVTKARLKPLNSLPPLGTPLMSPKFV